MEQCVFGDHSSNPINFNINTSPIHHLMCLAGEALPFTTTTAVPHFSAERLPSFSPKPEIVADRAVAYFPHLPGIV